MILVILSILSFILGCSFASFFGVICSRVPNNLSIVAPGSRCDNCGHSLKWYENIPILSFIFLGGKCKECKSKIGVSSVIFEAIGGVSLLLLTLKYKVSYQTLLLVPIVLILLLFAMYDFYTKTILDIFWILFLVFAVIYEVYKVVILKESIFDGLIGAGILLAFFILIKLVFYLVAKVDALGNGDIIVMGIAGLILTYKLVLISILVASLVGSIIELIIILVKKGDKEREIAFCPYLSLGILFSILYGMDIINFVMGVI